MTGSVTVTFPVPIAAGTDIQAQCYFFEQGLPRSVLFYNNTITIRPPGNIPYLVELESYLTPAAFLSSASAIPFAYMAEYIARGAARKILSDTGDVEQFMFYEPLFKEQETLVWNVVNGSSLLREQAQSSLIFKVLRVVYPTLDKGLLKLHDPACIDDHVLHLCYHRSLLSFAHVLSHSLYLRSLLCCIPFIRSWSRA